MPPYTPQCNPVKRTNRTVKTMLAQYVRKNYRTWDEHLMVLQYAFNTARHEVIGYSPAFLNHGRELARPHPEDRKWSTRRNSGSLWRDLQQRRRRGPVISVKKPEAMPQEWVRISSGRMQPIAARPSYWPVRRLTCRPGTDDIRRRQRRRQDQSNPVRNHLDHRGAPRLSPQRPITAQRQGHPNHHSGYRWPPASLSLCYTTPPTGYDGSALGPRRENESSASVDSDPAASDPDLQPPLATPAPLPPKERGDVTMQ